MQPWRARCVPQFGQIPWICSDFQMFTCTALWETAKNLAQNPCFFKYSPEKSTVHLIGKSGMCCLFLFCICSKNNNCAEVQNLKHLPEMPPAKVPSSENLPSRAFGLLISPKDLWHQAPCSWGTMGLSAGAAAGAAGAAHGNVRPPQPASQGNDKIAAQLESLIIYGEWI